MRDLPDFDRLLPDPAARRFADNDDAFEAVLDSMTLVELADWVRDNRFADNDDAFEDGLDSMTLVELADWVRDNRLAREAFESDFADQIADYMADV